MKAMILAAGLGTRLRPYSNRRPKPMFPIMGRPLLLHTIAKLRNAGFSSIIVNCHHLSHQVVDLLQHEEDLILQVEPEILGTGGGLRMALDHFDDEPILVTNGDIYHDIDYGQIYRQHLECGCRISMVMHDFPRFNKVNVNSSGFVTHLAKSSHSGKQSDELLAFTGIHVIDPQILKSIPLNCCYNIIDRYSDYLEDGGFLNAIIEKNVFWQDMGTPADYLSLHAYLMEENWTVGFGSLQKIDGSQFVASGDITLGRNITFNSWGVIGHGATIGENSILERVVIWDGAIVPANSVLKDTIVC